MQPSLSSRQSENEMTLPPDDIVSPGELDGPSSQEKDILVSFLSIPDIFKKKKILWSWCSSMMKFMI